MFFFLGGVSPKTLTVDETLRRCPACGLYQARRKRIDHYLNLFFIPVLRVRKGAPFLFCERCKAPVDETREPGGGAGPSFTDAVCRGCGRRLAPDHRYCPGCGRPR